MKLDSLQKKYPEFVYKGFEYKLENGDLAADFLFTLGDIRFHPGIIVRRIDKKQIKKIGKAQIQNLIFHLGLAEIPTYWKTTCSSKIIIEAGYLDKTQIKFWQDLIEKGMGQFFYENKLAFIRPKFEISAPKPKKFATINNKFAPRFLIPMGGGKDSLVTLELLRQAGKKLATFTINANEPLRKFVKVAAAKNIFVERRIDSKLIELNRQGFYNGHTPFSSILAFLGVTLAALFDYKYVTISQERSSDEGNMKYLGKMINHQYTKTLEFENKFRDSSKEYLAKNIEHFSFLRPLFELQIAGIFSQYPKYLPYFLSCNKPFTLASRAAGQTDWCGQCPKCLSTFAMLYPFIGRARAVKVFGRNLYSDKDLLPVMLELLGQGRCKPFECVATFSESRSAFYLSLRKTFGSKPYLLAYFEKNVLPKYPRISQETNKILSSWNRQNNLPKSLQKTLKNAIV